MDTSHNNRSLQDYVLFFSQLNVNKSKKKGNAPYQREQVTFARTKELTLKLGIVIMKGK